MIYTIEQIEKLYDQLKNNKEIAEIRGFQNIKTVSKPEKINPDIKIISY
ncbi:TPA: hypothetical protein ACGO4R_000672 [Streptococcus suis]